MFVITAYSPVLLIWWGVSIYNTIKEGKVLGFIDFGNFKFSELFNRLNIIFIFTFLVIVSWYIFKIANTKLTKNIIEIKSIKSADQNMTTLIASYFLPCVEFYKKDVIYVFIWIIVTIIIILISRGTYFYNPLVKLFGYRYYDITTKKDVGYLMISKQKLINSNDIKAYSQLTDYVILNATK